MVTVRDIQVRDRFKLGDELIDHFFIVQDPENMRDAIVCFEVIHGIIELDKIIDESVDRVLLSIG